jgi:hypothetical protein
VPEPAKVPQDLRATRATVAPQFSSQGEWVPARPSTVARPRRRDASHLPGMLQLAPSLSLILKLGRSTPPLWSPSGTARSSFLLRAGTGVAASSPVRPRLQFADERCSIESRRCLAHRASVTTSRAISPAGTPSRTGAGGPTKRRLDHVAQHRLSTRLGWEAGAPLAIRGPLRRSAEQPRAVPFLPEGPPRERVPTEGPTARRCPRGEVYYERSRVRHCWFRAARPVRRGAFRVAR